MGGHFAAAIGLKVASERNFEIFSNIKLTVLKIRYVVLYGTKNEKILSSFVRQQIQGSRQMQHCIII
jgi:hypothetical protein